MEAVLIAVTAAFFAGMSFLIEHWLATVPLATAGWLALLAAERRKSTAAVRAVTAVGPDAVRRAPARRHRLVAARAGR